MKRKNGQSIYIIIMCRIATKNKYDSHLFDVTRQKENEKEKNVVDCCYACIEGIEIKCATKKRYKTKMKKNHFIRMFYTEKKTRKMVGSK